MNVYEEAHHLTNAIKDSEEYKQYMAAKEKAKETPDFERLLREFQTKQIALQAKKMSGEEITADDMKGLQQLQAYMVQNPYATEYMQCEMRFSLMIKDVYEILGQVIDFGVNFNEL